MMLLAVSGALFAALGVPAMAQVQPPSRDLLPDGDTRPSIVTAALQHPDAGDRLLEASLIIDADDNDGIRRYEYRWNRATLGAIHTTSVTNPTVSYATITPDTEYVLQVRAVDLNGWESPWFTAWSGTTPSAPNLIVAGDSIASGYTRQWFTGDATCLDPQYAYGQTVAADLSAMLPDAWAPVYTNIAWAGAGVGSMLDGGVDSCGVAHPAQVDQIERLTPDDTWNIVVVTTGINSTNWTNVVVGLTKDTAFSLTDSGDKNACKLAVASKWNIDDRRDYITQRTDAVSAALTSRTNARVYWTGYYDIVGSQLAPGWTPIGEECRPEMGTALGELHGALRSGLPETTTWVDISGAVPTQRWAGWPHPSTEGHIAIGHTVAAAVTADLSGNRTS